MLFRSGDAGWTATLSPDQMKDGPVYYFVRGLDPNGRKVMVFAGPRNPWKVTVDGAKVKASGPRAGIFGSFEWQEFYLENRNTDAFWRAEAGVEYRFQRGAVRAIRAGFGALEGIGGRREDVEADMYLSHRAVGYAWLEPVFRFGRYARWTPRVMLGAVGDYSVGNPWDDRPNYQRGEVIGGASMALEFGPEDRFGIGVKGGFLVPVGAEMAVFANVHAPKGFRAGVQVGASSFPVHEDWAGQAMLLLGWHGVEWMSIDAKVGVNVRSTEHAGVGGGLGLSFWW